MAEYYRDADALAADSDPGTHVLGPQIGVVSTTLKSKLNSKPKASDFKLATRNAMRQFLPGNEIIHVLSKVSDLEKKNGEVLLLLNSINRELSSQKSGTSGPILKATKPKTHSESPEHIGKKKKRRRNKQLNHLLKNMKLMQQTIAALTR